MPAGPEQQLSVRLPWELAQWLDEEAKASGTAKVVIIRRALEKEREQVKAHEAGVKERRARH